MVEGEFRPGGRGREWCDADVLRSIRRRSLARLRQEVEPVEAPVLGRFLTAVARHRTRARRAGRPARCHRAAAGRAARRVAARARDPAGARRRLRAGRSSIRCSAPAKWCGSASSRSANATAASRSTSPITCRGCSPPVGPASERGGRRSGRARVGGARTAPDRGRVVLRAAPRVGRRRLPARNGRRAVGPGVAGPRHQRHAARAARLPASAGARAAARAGDAVPLAAARPAGGGRTLDRDRGQSRPAR